MAVNIRSFLISVTHLYTSLYTQAMLALTHAQRCWQSRHIVHRVLREKMAESSLLRVCLLLLLQFCVERTRAHMIYQCWSCKFSTSCRYEAAMWYIQSLFPKEGIVSKVTFADNYHGVLLLWKICAWGCPCATHSQPPLLNRRIPSLWKVAASSMQCLSVGFQRPTSSYGGGKNTTSVRGYIL